MDTIDQYIRVPRLQRPRAQQFRFIVLASLFALVGRLAAAEGDERPPGKPKLPASGWVELLSKLEETGELGSFLARNERSTKTVFVASRPINEKYPTLDTYYPAWVKGFTNQADRVISEGFTECGGVRAYQVTGVKRNKEGKPVHAQSIVLYSKGRVFAITLGSAAPSIAEDQEFRSILGSMEFGR